jgi:hypothetical protein
MAEDGAAVLPVVDVVNSNSTALHLKPWTNESELAFAGALICTLLLLKCLLFLFAAPKIRVKQGLARSGGPDLASVEVEEEYEEYSLGTLLWKTLRWRRALPDDAPTASLFSALRHSFETRKRSNMRAVQV